MSTQRTKEAELIAALYLYASRCWAEGDLLALRGIGFGRREIEDLLSLNLADIQRLCTLNGHPLRVRIDAETFRMVVEHLRRERRREQTLHALITADAPLPMMQALYGMDSKDYTGWRQILAMPTAIGRPPEPDEALVERVWEAWGEVLGAREPDTVEPEEFLALHTATEAPLRLLWNLLITWTTRGGAEQTLDAADEGAFPNDGWGDLSEPPQIKPLAPRPMKGSDEPDP